LHLGEIGRQIKLRRHIGCRRVGERRDVGPDDDATRTGTSSILAARLIDKPKRLTVRVAGADLRRTGWALAWSNPIHVERIPEPICHNFLLALNHSSWFKVCMNKLACNTETHKHCPRCETVKLRTEFYTNKNAYDGLQGLCRLCSIALVQKYRKTPKGQKSHRAASKRWRENNLERNADNNVRWRYGIENGTYAVLLEQQKGVCAICKGADPGSRLRRFHVDHCHNSKEVRGLLCEHCNRGLGHFKDSVQLLQNAISYLSAKRRIEG
jgi:Recombination endonuclease VII